MLWGKCSDLERRQILHYVADYADVLWAVLEHERSKDREIIEGLFMQRMNYLVASAPWVFFGKGKGKNIKRHIQMLSEPDLTLCRMKISPNCFIDVEHTKVNSLLCGNCACFSVINEVNGRYFYDTVSIWEYVDSIASNEFRGKSLDELINMSFSDGFSFIKI